MEYAPEIKYQSFIPLIRSINLPRDHRHLRKGLENLIIRHMRGEDEGAMEDTLSSDFLISPGILGSTWKIT